MNPAYGPNEQRSNPDDAPVIQRGLPAGSHRRAAELYWEAFGRKLGPGLGPAEAGITFLAEHLHPDRAIVALRNGVLVGLAGYRDDGRGLTGGTVRDVLRAYGGVRALHRVALLALFERRPARGEFLMDGIAVAADQRGTGIGGLLLAEIATLAHERGYRRIRLDVIDTNPRARALYERHGFTATKTEHAPFLRTLMGFSATTTMTRRLPG
ncbi:GNAT family N-acetyltransferase [Embleya sp. AB8]|uniref:GNAT family N-acetyltransferase n=1 Tax=Embleya sp. AB8 TaxID=3156304 RepID=UPI003C718DAD